MVLVGRRHHREIIERDLRRHLRTHCFGAHLALPGSSEPSAIAPL
jgi:hypothetical protein